jgi:hypothetical protein
VRAAFFFGMMTTVGTVWKGAAGQSIPTVEGTQRLADRPRGRIIVPQVGRRPHPEWRAGAAICALHKHSTPERLHEDGWQRLPKSLLVSQLTSQPDQIALAAGDCAK